MISAIISTYNRERYLPKLFESISKQNYLNFEIIIIDNNSPGNTKELTDNFLKNNSTLNIRYFLEKKQGLSFARNRGIQEAKGDIITFLDDDAYISENYFERISYYFKQYLDVMAIGSKILLDYESTVPNWENRFLNSLLGYFNLGNNIKYFKNNKYPRGSNMSFRKDTFNTIGIFNTKLGRIKSDLGGGEEKDLFMRMYKNNLQVLYVPDAIVYHFVPEERTKSNFIKKQAIGVGKSEYIRIKEAGARSIVKKIVEEIYKWLISCVLFVYFLITIRVYKGWMIIKFRYWVNKGLLSI